MRGQAGTVLLHRALGTRRLGRSGLSLRPPTDKDNVWHIDCSSFFPSTVGGMSIHGAYFDTKAVVNMMREILRGIDRSVLASLGRTQAMAWPAQAAPA